MTTPRAFISFDFDHNEAEKHLFVGQARNSRTPFSIEDWSSKSSLPLIQWEQSIADKIKKCNILIVLVGKTMASATGVAKEIAFAKVADVPVFGVYVDGADETSNLPDGLSRSCTFTWEWNKIALAIETCMGIGKNK
ncbi:MAG: TIR domain-containing protein [Elusimicrobiota bacterium]|jgi:hypothetical protein|nr:TIR domain-containing protein [Elusimicrobiota bacterium]